LGGGQLVGAAAEVGALAFPPSVPAGAFVDAPELFEAEDAAAGGSQLDGGAFFLWLGREPLPLLAGDFSLGFNPGDAAPDAGGFGCCAFP